MILEEGDGPEGEKEGRGNPAWQERRGMEKRKKNRGKRTGIILAILALAAVVALMIAAVYLISRRADDGGEPAIEQRGLVVDTRATDTGKSGTKEGGADPLAGRNVYFSGMEDAIIGLDTVVQLDNREENLDFLLRYEIYDVEGNLVHETDLIPSGQHVDWVPGETLGTGEHTLSFLQIPYYVDGAGEYIGLTQGSCQVTLAIPD